ncbi:MAG: inosine/xanthosine triphosphatase [Calditrichaeota bacterium]|nr:MAG: inosine/xanthosine triphosphatase [Calditrichota bacterium]
MAEVNSKAAVRVLVASTNPVKVQAAQEAVRKCCPRVVVEGHRVASGVAAQPCNEETFTGARNRVEQLAGLGLEADFLIGIEGGIVQLYRRWFALGVICVRHRSGREAFGTSPAFELPEPIVRQLLSGKELGTVMDELTGRHNTKQQMGAIGILTGGVMDRKSLYVQGLITALVPLLNPRLYFDQS